MISLRELKERKIVQWAIAYLAGAWVLVEVSSLVGDHFAWPGLWLRMIIVVLAIGFFAALILAWYHGEKGAQRVSTVEFGLLTGVLIIAGVGVAWVQAPSAESPSEAPPPAVDSSSRADGRVAEQGSIAVLPFADISAEKDQEYFSDGITEELLNVLAQLPELRVASRTSAFSFKGKDVGIDSIARALNVRHVLEGSVRKAGDQVRITAQLIDASTGYHLWSETYDRTLRDIFAVQDEISREIVKQLQIKLGGGRDQRRLAKEETKDPEAHTLVLKGLHFLHQQTRESLEQAETLLKQAVARDPSYARAYAALGRVYSAQAYSRYGRVEELNQQARASLERALELDPDLAEAHHLAGLVAYDGGHWDRAETSFARAVELNPGFALAHSIRALLLADLGRPEEAVKAAERAAALDPVYAGVHNNLAVVYVFARQYERAARAYEAALALRPDQPIILGNLALVYSFLERHEEGIRVAEQARNQAPTAQFPLGSLAYVYARAGRRTEAEAVLRTLEDLPEPSPYLLATVYAGLEERDRVFSLLEQAVAERDALVVSLGVDPPFDRYRSDPRMRGLLERLDLPAESR